MRLIQLNRSRASELIHSLLSLEYANIEFKDLKTLATVGIGGFGRVVLVKHIKDGPLKIFALKQMKKVHILETKQEEHVFNERRIMLSCELPLNSHIRMKNYFVRAEGNEKTYLLRSNYVFPLLLLLFFSASEVSSPFVCRLYRTYRDTKFIYLLLEVRNAVPMACSRN